ncbi:hypothetical protein F8388_005882, partial [Cannabis sativa]
YIYSFNHNSQYSVMVAAGARITYSRQPHYDPLWFSIVLVTSVVATIYQLYWDFVKDWGLLNPKSRNAWLRDDLILKNKSTYYVSMGLNVLLRVAWVETVMGFRIGAVESRLVDLFWLHWKLFVLAIGIFAGTTFSVSLCFLGHCLSSHE